MKVIGIISEFNPFHNGHFYLFQQLKKNDPTAAIICVMSGNFVQRGEPAVCSKWSRAEMALRCGADLVIELPFCYAVRSAYYFAKGAIRLLQRTGTVTHLAFGTETEEPELLQKIAAFIATEPLDYKTELKKHLSHGQSFPRARANALKKVIDYDSINDILLMPNNILAIEYLRVINEDNIPLIPIAIKRQGSGYHSLELGEYTSATALRRLLKDHPEQLSKLSEYIPEACYNILKREITKGMAPVYCENIEQILLAKLRLSSRMDLSPICEISEGLENRLWEAAYSAATLESLRMSVKSKRYSLTRINRILLYCLFAFNSSDASAFDEQGPLYLHILGFTPKGQDLLHNIKLNSQLLLISRGSEMKAAASQKDNIFLQRMISFDIKASDIYSLLFPQPGQRKAGTDFINSPVFINQPF